MVAPNLNRKNVHDYLAMVKLVAQRLVKMWDCHATEGRAFNINKDILASTMDITSLVAFSNDIDSLRAGNSIMGNDLLCLFKAIAVRVILPFPYYHIPIIGQYLDGAGFTRDRVLRYFASMVEDHEASPILGDGERKNFLAKLVALRKKDSTTLSYKRLVGNLITMFLAGGETTFVTICSALYEIAMDRTNIQNELAEEALLLSGFDEAGLEELTNSLPRLRSMIYEILRIRGPAPLLDTATTSKFELDGCVLPPNTRIILPWRFISTLDSKDGTVGTPRGPLNASPADFCARRWLSRDGDASDGKLTVATPSFRTGYRAFGSGKRVCPGRDLAETETLVILAAILRTFEISLEEGHPPMTLVSRFTQSPDIDIRLVLKPRLKPIYAT